MKVRKNKFFIFVNLMILFNYFNNYYLAQTKQNSIIELFCLQSVKDEMLKVEMEYSEEIANKTCECYYEEFIQTASHKEAKTKCKFETLERVKHNRKI